MLRGDGKSTELLAHIAKKLKRCCERKEIGNLEFVLPSQTAVAKMVENFALITFRDMANTIENEKKQGKIVTYCNLL